MHPLVASLLCTDDPWAAALVGLCAGLLWRVVAASRKIEPERTLAAVRAMQARRAKRATSPKVLLSDLAGRWRQVEHAGWAAMDELMEATERPYGARLLSRVLDYGNGTYLEHHVHGVELTCRSSEGGTCQRVRTDAPHKRQMLTCGSGTPKDHLVRYDKATGTLSLTECDAPVVTTRRVECVGGARRLVCTMEVTSRATGQKVRATRIYADAAERPARSALAVCLAPSKSKLKRA